MPAYHTYADHYKNNTNCTKIKAKIVKINGSAKIVKINGSGKKTPDPSPQYISYKAHKGARSRSAL